MKPIKDMNEDEQKALVRDMIREYQAMLMFGDKEEIEKLRLRFSKLGYNLIKMDQMLNDRLPGSPTE